MNPLYRSALALLLIYSFVPSAAATELFCNSATYGLASEGFVAGDAAQAAGGFIEATGNGCDMFPNACPNATAEPGAECARACSCGDYDSEEDTLQCQCFFTVTSDLQSCAAIGKVDANGDGICEDDPADDECAWPENGLNYYDIDWTQCDVPNNGDEQDPDCTPSNDPYQCQGAPTDENCDPALDPFNCDVPSPQFGSGDQNTTNSEPTSCPSGYTYNSANGTCSQDGTEGDEGCPRGVYYNPNNASCDPNWTPFDQQDTTTTSGTSTTTDNGDGTSTTNYTQTETDDTPNQIGGGSCATSTPPQCSGDPVLCYIARENWKQTCLAEGPGLEEIQEAIDGDSQTDEGLLDGGSIDVAGQLDDSGFLAAGCPAPVQVSTPIHSFQIPFDFFCDLAEYIRVFLVGFAFLWAGRLIVEAF